MAESHEQVFFEGSGLDINENMPNSQNCSFPNVEPLENTTPSIICPVNDSAFIETSNTSVDCIKASESCSEVSTNKSDVKHDNEFAFNQKADSGIHDFENNIIESTKLIEFDNNEQNFCENFGAVISNFLPEENDTEFKDEEFHDAVQFFKDPSSLVFLEKAGSSNAPSESLMARSSLYQKFDPLHAKFFSQPTGKPNELLEITEDEVEPENDKLGSALISPNLQSELETIKPQDNINDALIEVIPDQSNVSPTNDTSPTNDSVPDIINKHISLASPRQSLGNILISFDSPVINKDTNSKLEAEKVSDVQKMFTEEEMQQSLKIQELTLQETFLKKQQELEETLAKRQQELETKLEHQKHLSNSLYSVLKEFVDFTFVLTDKEKLLKEKIETVEKENNKLKEDLKTSVEDIQSVETTFSDFHKRYEQCKNMLKVYTENEKSLKQQLESMNMQLHEKDEMYKALQSRTQEMLDKANAEVANTKKAGDAQVAVLKAQLKKAEMKISSLESDVKHVKIENGKLSSICDELMAKVSET